ncbi:hypothetical protein pah_c022o159 [Parachlamydia acanthamoebae str. Hall's coccus]|nr:hypothetical protein pah_c022o159 [Parachlamydia acanthamoebae str. Hall's coccus]
MEKKFMKYLYLFVISLALGIFLHGRDGETEGENPRSTFEIKVGEEFLEILANPDSIKFGKVLPTGFAMGGSGQEYLSEEPLISLSSSQIAQIQNLLLSPKNFIVEKTKSGLFLPEYVLYFKKEEKTLTVLVSSFINQIRIEGVQSSVVLDFDPMQDEMKACLDYFKSL